MTKWMEMEQFKIRTQKTQKSQSKQNSRLLRRIATGWLICQSILIGTPVLAQEEPDLSYSELLEKIEQGEVQKIQIDETTGTAEVNLVGDEEDATSETVKLLNQNPELINKINQFNAQAEQSGTQSEIILDFERSADHSAALGIAANLFLLVVLLAGLIMILRRSAASSGQALNFGKSKARFQMEAKTGITFTDVAGINEAKEELQEVVTFLKETERFTAIGARDRKSVV